MLKFRLKLKKWWRSIRFGTVKKEVRVRIGGEVCEVAYLNRKGKIVGYWAYGYYDPSLPYREF